LASITITSPSMMAESHRQLASRFDDRRVFRGPVKGAASERASHAVLDQHLGSVTVIFDLMNPARYLWRILDQVGNWNSTKLSGSTAAAARLRIHAPTPNNFSESVLERSLMQALRLMRGGQQPEESPPARFLRRVLSGPVDRPDGFWSNRHLGETNETLLRSSRNTAEIGTTYRRSFNQWSSECLLLTERMRSSVHSSLD
jgi:hypothetical protein